MNEPSNFCIYPCDNPGAEATQGVTRELDMLKIPQKPPSRRLAARLSTRQNGNSTEPKRGLPNRNLIDPPYKIQNTFGPLSYKTADTDLIHRGGWTEYDTHNL